MDDGRFLRLISIDPGNAKPAVTVWEYDLETKERVVTNSWTIDAARYLKTYEYLEGLYTSRAIIQLGLKETLVWLFGRVQPHAVICESNFLSRFPQAFAGLVEVVGCSVRAAIMEHDPMLGLHMVDPISAKSAVGAKCKGGSKEDVQLALTKLTNVVWMQSTPVLELGFDACDSIAIGYAWIDAMEQGKVKIGGV